jgi:hypothetical protein
MKSQQLRTLSRAVVALAGLPASHLHVATIACRHCCLLLHCRILNEAALLLPLQVLLQCPKLQSLTITGCSQLESLMLWSDEITELDLTGNACSHRSCRSSAAWDLCMLNFVNRTSQISQAAAASMLQLPFS